MKTKHLRSTLIPALLTCFVAAFYLTGIETVKFFGDESRWIARSQVFEEFFTARFGSPYFDESYRTLTNPPTGVYLIGMGRRIGGYRWADLSLPWNWELVLS